jgi:dUTP pyrophosphatase
MTIKLVLLDNAVIPFKAHETDACYDVVATSKKDLGDGRIEYGLGIKLQPELKEQDIQFDFRARSSVHKTGMILSNCIGTGDEGYTGEYKAVFYKIIPSLPDYEVGDKILQMQVTKAIPINFEIVTELNPTPRGEGGFGSTNK